MARSRSMAFATFLSFTFLASVALAQTANGGAPLGSKSNPIPVSVVGGASPLSTPGAKGAKRGSKQNPIKGQTHPRVSLTPHP
jgi:hypothetical protein